MSTHYKPTQFRGKRVIYQSMDPDEPRRETRKGIIFLLVFLGLIAVITLLHFR